MIDIKKCVTVNKNTGNSLRKSIQKEIDLHVTEEEWICSGPFTTKMEYLGLAKAPITHTEMLDLMKAFDEAQ